MKTADKVEKIVTVSHYTEEQVAQNQSKDLMTGSYATLNENIFNAIRNSDERLKDAKDLDIIAYALKTTYNLSNEVKELSLMMSRTYNLKSYHKDKFAETKKEVATTDTTSKDINETVMTSIQAHRDNKEKLEDIEKMMFKLVASKKLALTNAQVVAHIFEQKQREKKAVAQIFSF